MQKTEMLKQFEIIDNGMCHIAAGNFTADVKPSAVELFKNSWPESVKEIWAKQPSLKEYKPVYSSNVLPSGDVRYCNPYRPRQQKIKRIYAKLSNKKRKESNYYYSDGYFMNSRYLVKMPKPKGFKFQELSPPIENLIKLHSSIDVKPLCEINDAEWDTPIILLITENNEYITVNAEYYNTINTLHPNAYRCHDEANNSIKFIVDGGVVAVLMPLRQFGEVVVKLNDLPEWIQTRIETIQFYS